VAQWSAVAVEPRDREGEAAEHGYGVEGRAAEAQVGHLGAGGAIGRSGRAAKRVNSP
jgi:hypothetical protein